MSAIGPGSPTSFRWPEQWADFSDYFFCNQEPTVSPNSFSIPPFPLSHIHNNGALGCFGISSPASDTTSIQPVFEYADGLGPGMLEATGELEMDTLQRRDLVHSTTRSEPGKAKRKTCRDRNWTEAETSVVVECMSLVSHGNGSAFRKPKSGGTDWEAISKELRNNPDTRASEKTGDQCRLRWDTLRKAYRRIKETAKGYAELTEEEMGDLKLATMLKKEWYEKIDIVMSRKDKSQKRDKPPSERPSGHGAANLEYRNENFSPSTSAAQVSKGRPLPGNILTKQVAIPGFLSLDDQLKSTLVDLILGTRFLRDRWFDGYDRDDQTLKFCCQWLSIVQNRSCTDIYHDVIVLVKMELVQISTLNGVLSLDGSHFRAFDKFVKKVIRANPRYDIHRHVKSLDDPKYVPAREVSAPQQIRVLKLDRCRGLESVDFRGLRKLRSLFLYRCPGLKEITGWKFLRELGWLEMDCCTAYHEYPEFQVLPSLQEFRFNRYYVSDCLPRFDLGISHCVRLRRLEIWCDNLLEGSGDLSSLKCLEILSFYECGTLSSVTGLHGLHSLTHLSVAFCLALRVLPDVSNLKELACVDTRRTGLEEIPGVENLVSLKTLDCRHSNLRALPDLHHLPALRKVWLGDTPLIEDDASSFYFDKCEVQFNCEETSRVDVSDVSDVEYNLSDSSGD